MSIRFRYTVSGAAFGLCFPIVSTLLACYTRPVPDGCLQLHLQEPLLLIIDTAPFFLGLFAYFIGRSIESRIAHERAAQEAIRLREAEQRASAERLGQQNDDLRKLNEMLDALVYTASHDLKTPVVNFQSMLKMLREVLDKPDSGPMVENILQRMDTATLRFLQTISGLLDVSRVERMDSDMPKEPIDLEEFIAEVWEGIAAVAENQGAKLTFSRMTAPVIHCNRDALQSVMLNLLTNALKYADAQRPCRVEVSSELHENVITIRVKDNGIGIDLATQGEKLFRMFKRLSRQSEGSGIGLYIVRRTLQKLGADIRAQSQLGQGTTFVMEFPIV